MCGLDSVRAAWFWIQVAVAEHNLPRLGCPASETRAFTFRTFDRLSANLLKGMSREDEKVIF